MGTIVRVLATLAVSVSLARAAPVTITGEIRDASGALLSGIAVIELSDTCVGVSGALILKRPVRIPFNNGALSVQLEPNSVCPTSPLYVVRYQVNRVFIGPVEYWVVPPSPTTTTIAAVKRESAQPPTFAAATTKGDLGVFDGLAWRKLPRGADGQVLKAASAEPTGLKWDVGGGTGSGTAEWASPTLNFGTLIDYQCDDRTFTATGLAVGTPLLTVPYSGIGPVSYFAWASATDTAKVRVCNASGGDVAVSGIFTLKQVASGYLSGSGALDFPNIIATGYQQLTLTITGATAAMSALVVPPAAVSANLQITGRVTAPNTLTITAANLSDADIDPPSGSFNGVLIQ